MKLTASLSFLALLAIVYITSFSSGQFDKTTSSETEILSEFTNWKVQFNRDYESITEEIYRFSVFRVNQLKIQQHNSKKDKTYEMGLNQFSDLTEEEFKARHLTFIPQSQSSLRAQVQHQESTVVVSDDTDINWVEKGYVTNVKDEGQCGSCWAFAALGPLEALIKQQGQPLVSLSAQQLMDCSSNYGNYGCNGGLMDASYKYIKDSGVTTEDKYPYKGAYQKCLTYGGEYKVNGYVDVKDCKTVASSLAKIPIAVAVDASKFYSYKSGVFSGCSDKPQLNHAFALVGMTADYWLGKDSWGVKWGENGYIRIAKTGSACGICMMASYPV